MPDDAQKNGRTSYIVNFAFDRDRNSILFSGTSGYYTETVIPYHQNAFQAITAGIGFSSRKLVCMVTSRFLQISQTFNGLLKGKTFFYLKSARNES
jgi:hypothetical protein